MDSKLFTYYSIDECNDVDALNSKLKEYVEEGKLEFKEQGRDLIKIKDIDLDDYEVDELIDLLDSLDVFPYMEYTDDEDSDYDDYVDDEDEYDGYSSKKYKDDDSDY